MDKETLKSGGNKAHRHLANLLKARLMNKKN